MSVSRYLVAALIALFALVVWDALDTNNTPQAPILAPQSQKTKTTQAVATPVHEQGQVLLVDLFPAWRHAQPEAEYPATPPVQKIAATFPLRAIGAWWENNERILIVGGEEVNFLFCKKCRKKESIHPGEMILPDWKLIALEEDHFMVGSLSEATTQRIELDDLTSEPAR
ncbi:hypothetical protein ACSN7O_004629 [Enterobacter chuandaensis]